MSDTPTINDTGKTVVHRGRTYKILLPETHRDIAPYIIEGKTGVQYALTRNVPKPEHLFGIRFGAKMGVLPGWFTDKSGELVSLG
jgi:hypothetical protein